MKPSIYLSVVTKQIQSATDDDNDRYEYAIYVGDEFYGITCCVNRCEQDAQQLITEIEQKADKYKVILIGINRDTMIEPTFITKLWQHYDIIPVTIELGNNTMSIEELAYEVFKRALNIMAPAAKLPSIVDINVNHNNYVQVDANYHVHLASKEDYKKITHNDIQGQLEDALTWLRNTNLHIGFINSTPRGGGVAMMRHALLRYFNANSVHNIDWMVMIPDYKVFQITKSKFHNVLQGVSDTALTDNDKQVYEEWCHRNIETNWKTRLVTYDILVIDDLQPIGLVPWIKSCAPNCTLVYRNHIQMDVDKVDDNNMNNICSQASLTFEYLSKYIKQCDIMVNHPIDIPKRLANAVQINYTFPATTDPLDGLNKSLSNIDQEWYLDHFDRLCLEIGQPVADRKKSWIVQIARFDPSKGIQDVIKAYLELPSYVKNMTHLIITGHGSIDDPEGNGLCEATQALVSVLDKDVRCKMTIIRIPPSDQILNVVLTRAKIALQLSLYEGFEVKVTEAILKGVPVIAYETGGIIHQIKDKKTGYLISRHDIGNVSQKITDLMTNETLYNDMHKACLNDLNDAMQFLTPHNALRCINLWKDTLDTD